VISKIPRALHHTMPSACRTTALQRAVKTIVLTSIHIRYSKRQTEREIIRKVCSSRASLVYKVLVLLFRNANSVLKKKKTPYSSWQPNSYWESQFSWFGKVISFRILHNNHPACMTLDSYIGGTCIIPFQATFYQALVFHLSCMLMDVLTVT